MGALPFLLVDGFRVAFDITSFYRCPHEETEFDPNDKSKSQNARHARWIALMEQNKGKIDVAAGQKFLSDHFDSYTGKVEPSERTLCGHIEFSPRGMGTWQAPYAAAGAVQNKVTDAAGAEKMSLMAALGHSCGIGYKAKEHLAKHPEFAWMRDVLRDMPARGWAKFTAK